MKLVRQAYRKPLGPNLGSTGAVRWSGSVGAQSHGVAATCPSHPSASMAQPTVAMGIPMTTAVLALAAVARRQASPRPALLFLTIKNYPLQLSTAEIGSECLN